MLKDSTTRRHFNRLLVRSTALIAAMATVRGGFALAEQKSEVPVPGGPLTTKSRVLDTGADLLQSKKPIDAMSEFLNGFHFYANDGTPGGSQSLLYAFKRRFSSVCDLRFRSSERKAVRHRIHSERTSVCELAG